MIRSGRCCPSRKSVIGRELGTGETGKSRKGAYLDNKVEVAQVISAGGGGVAASNSLALNLGGDSDVLSWGETEVVLGIRKTEAVESGVVRDGDLLDKREFAPFLRAEDRLAA